MKCTSIFFFPLTISSLVWISLNLSHLLLCSICLCLLPSNQFDPTTSSLYKMYLLWGHAEAKRWIVPSQPCLQHMPSGAEESGHADMLLFDLETVNKACKIQCLNAGLMRVGLGLLTEAEHIHNQIRLNKTTTSVVYIFTPLQRSLKMGQIQRHKPSHKCWLHCFMQVKKKYHENQSFSFTEHVTVQSWKFNGLLCWTGSHMYMGYFPSMIQINYACSQACIYPYLNSLYVLQQVDEGVNSDEGNSVGIHRQWIMVCLLLSIYACRTGVHHWDCQSLFLPWLVRMKRKERECVKRNVHTSVFLKFIMKTIIIFLVGISLVFF